MKITTSLIWAVAVGLQRLTSALTIAEINGNRFLSQYSGQAVTNITGLLIAKGPNGIWIRSTTPDNDPSTSEAIYVFGSVGKNFTTGDIITLDGKVTEYRSQPGYLHTTEITSPKNVKLISSNNEVKPLVIGKDTPSPPSSQFSGLDGRDVYSVPGGVANISVVNPVLKPKEFGMDFWESLSGELVTVRNPTVIQRPNRFGDTWVYGDWVVTGRNKHGGLTMTALDSNPEAILISSALDLTHNPPTLKMGDTLSPITGIIQYAFGFYSILPLTAPTPLALSSSFHPPSSLLSSHTCTSLTLGSYNVENLAPNSTHLPSIASHIVNSLLSPDLLFLQEIQDSSGPVDNDGIVSANLTLTTLVSAIASLSPNTTWTYDFTTIDPLPDSDGGQPGANIRQAYLFNPDVLQLYHPNPGSSSDATTILPGPNGPKLSFNPGRIDPQNEAWSESRKPLAAAWIAKGAKKPFYTVNVHFSSKGGGTGIQGDGRPPVNGGVERRERQGEVTGGFIKSILDANPKAKVIAAGDFNEFAFVEPMMRFKEVSGLVDLDEVVGIPAEERYTYVFDMSAQALDHMYVSPALAKSKVTKYEHLHLNSWAEEKDVVSDHDPSVALFNVCDC